LAARSFDYIGIPAPAKCDGMRLLEEAMKGHRVVAEPFDFFGEVRVAFVDVDGAPVEFVESYLALRRHCGAARRAASASVANEMRTSAVMRPRSVPSPLPTALAAAESAEPESSDALVSGGRCSLPAPSRLALLVGAPYAGDVAIAFSRLVSFPPFASTSAVTLGERVEAVCPPPPEVEPPAPEEEPPPPDACDPSLVGMSSTY
jgi:hypothetical protein